MPPNIGISVCALRTTMPVARLWVWGTLSCEPSCSAMVDTESDVAGNGRLHATMYWRVTRGDEHCGRAIVPVVCAHSPIRLCTFLLGSVLLSLLSFDPKESVTPPASAMDIGFEDENPFETEPERNHSDTSSSSRVAVSEPPSPLPTAARALSSPPQSPSLRRPTFPSQGSHRQPQTFKNEFCCARDQWLHSGEDVEILVDRIHRSKSSD